MDEDCDVYDIDVGFSSYVDGEQRKVRHVNRAGGFPR